MTKYLLLIVTTSMLLTLKSDIKNQRVKNFVDWYLTNKSQFVKFEQEETLEYRVEHIPSELFVAQKFKDSISIKKADLRKERETQESKYTFNIKLFDRNRPKLLKGYSKDLNDYNTKVTYLSFEMKNDFYLIHGFDTLSPDSYTFERGFDASPYCKFTVDFKSITLEYDLVFLFKDRVFKKKKKMFLFEKDIINNTPNI